MTSAGDAALLSLQACVSKGAQRACSPKSQCSLGTSPVLDSVLGAIGGVSRSFFILHAGRWLDVVPPWTKAVKLWMLRACTGAAAVMPVQLQT